MIYLVSGYMRSGTSMMMQALEAGGMRIVRSAYRDGINELQRDGRYTPNPGGLYEPDYREISPTWPRQYDGKAVKVVVPYLRDLAAHEYRAVFMRRDAEEIRQSYRAAFNARMTPGVKEITQRCEEALATLRNRKDVRSVDVLNYAEVLADPSGAIESLDWPVDSEDAATVVDQKQYRFRRERLVVGL